MRLSVERFGGGSRNGIESGGFFIEQSQSEENARSMPCENITILEGIEK